jgi:hypothetical protein
MGGKAFALVKFSKKKIPSITRYLEGYKVSSNIQIGVLLHH